MKRYERLLVASLISGAFYLPALHAGQPPVPPTEKVGLQKNGSVVLPDSQVIEPAGHQITVIGRPSVILGWTDRHFRSGERNRPATIDAVHRRQTVIDRCGLFP